MDFKNFNDETNPVEKQKNKPSQEDDNRLENVSENIENCTIKNPVVYLDDALEGNLVRARADNLVRARVDNRVRARVGNLVRARVGNLVRARAGNRVRAHVGNLVRARAGNRVRARVGNWIRARERNRVRAREGFRVRAREGNLFGASAVSPGIWCCEPGQCCAEVSPPGHCYLAPNSAIGCCRERDPLAGQCCSAPVYLYHQRRAVVAQMGN